MNFSVGFWAELHQLVAPEISLQIKEKVRETFSERILDLFNSEEKLICKIKEVLQKTEALNAQQLQDFNIVYQKIENVSKDPVIKQKYKELSQRIVSDSSERTEGDSPEQVFDQTSCYDKWIADKEIQARLLKGEDMNALLKEAFQQGQTAGASWLIAQGASLTALENICSSPDDKARYEWLMKRHAMKIATPETLDHFAVDIGYGYKSANLLVLGSQLKEVKLEASQLQVPSFLPISSFEMQEYLLDAVPEIEQKWNLFLQSFDPELKEKFLSQKSDAEASRIPLKISEEGLKIIEEIKILIKKRFLDCPYSTLQFEEWIKSQFSNPDLASLLFLIIRSTGKEDTKGNCNAGGNESIPFVKPELKDINLAMGKVIASYFDVKSITQRLGAGDRTIFDGERPFIPILFQNMITENVDGKDTLENEIPRSGVLFTCQNDKAKEITLIQTGLGGNEGMVNGAVDFDTASINSKHQIRRGVKRKETRFVNVSLKNGKFKAQEIRNENKTLEIMPALKPAIIRDLKRVADFVASLYSTTGEKEPMDMEYTIKLQDLSRGQTKPVIYLLQARPLAEVPFPHLPSFINLEECQNIPAQNKVKVQTLLHGHSFVRKINDTNEVLFADDMKAAFEDPALDSQKIQAIFIRKTEPSTSHYALMLTPKGIPVFVVESPKEYERIRTMINHSQAEVPVVVDTQRGLVVEKLKEMKIQEGFISYPMSSEMTLPIPPITLRGIRLRDAIQTGNDNKAKIANAYLKVAIPNFNNRVKKILDVCLGSNDALIVSKSGTGNENSLSHLVELMATQETPQAKVALGSLIKYLYSNLLSHMQHSESLITNAVMPNFMVLENLVNLAEKEILPALEKFPPQSLDRLYYLKCIDTLLFQKPSPNVLFGFSYGYGALTIKEITKMSEEMKRQGFNNNTMTQDHLFLMFFKHHIWNEEIQQIWIDLLKGLDNEEARELRSMMSELCTLKMEAHWLNIIFIDLWNAKKDSKLFLESFKQVWKEGEQQRFLQMKKMIHLQSLERQIELWKKNQHASKSIDSFKQSYIDSFQNLGKTYQEADKFCRLAILDNFSYAFDIYDRTIKSVESSDEIEEKDKIKYVAQLLEGYFSMMKFAFQLLSKNDEVDLMALKEISCDGEPFLQFTLEGFVNHLEKGGQYNFGGHHAKFRHEFTGFIQLVQEAKNGISNGKQLESRSLFNVEAMIIGAQVDRDYSAHWASCLEEYFMLFHQNMIKVMEYKRAQLGMNKNILPDFARPIVDLTETSFSTKDSKTSISGMTEENGQIAVNFNIPLMQHSGQLTLRITPNDPKRGFELSGQVFGADEHNRWDRIAAFVSLLAHRGDGVSFINGIPPQINYQAETRSGVSFALHVPYAYSGIRALIDKMPYLYRVLTKKVSNHTEWGTIDWDQQNMQCFADAFYGSVGLLNQLSESNQHKRAAKVAQYSLLGLAQKRLPDYTKECNYNLPGYLGDSLYGFVTDNKEKRNSFTGLKQAAILHLIKAVKEGPRDEIEPIIKAILNEPILAQVFNNEMTSLKQFTDTIYTV